jgi:RNA polymerase sigma-70 factor (ECF subfamily)
MTTPPSTRQEVTQLLGEWSGGDEGALEKLFPLVQPELQRLAHHYMSRERAGHTLQTTAILNEAYLRLIDNTKPVWQGRSHFIAAAAKITAFLTFAVCPEGRRLTIFRVHSPAGKERP